MPRANDVQVIVLLSGPYVFSSNNPVELYNLKVMFASFFSVTLTLTKIQVLLKDVSLSSVPVPKSISGKRVSIVKV